RRVLADRRTVALRPNCGSMTIGFGRLVPALRGPQEAGPRIRREIQQATGLSIRAASYVKAGKAAPHRRHWEALSHLAGSTTCAYSSLRSLPPIAPPQLPSL